MVFLNQIWEAGTWCLFSTGTLSQETSPPSSLVELSPTQPAAAQAVDTLGGNGSKGNERKVRKRRSEAQFSRHPFFQMIFPLDQETPWNLFRPFLPFRKFPHKAACSAGVWKMQASKNEKLCSSRGRSNPSKGTKHLYFKLFSHIFTLFTRYVASFSCRPLWVPKMAFVGFIVLSKLGGSSKPELRSMALWMRSGVRWFWHFSGLQFRLTDEHRWTTFFALLCPDIKERSSILTRSWVVALIPYARFCRVQPREQIIHKLHESLSMTTAAQHQPMLRDFQIFHLIHLWGNVITLYLLWSMCSHASFCSPNSGGLFAVGWPRVTTKPHDWRCIFQSFFVELWGASLACLAWPSMISLRWGDRFTNESQELIFLVQRPKSSTCKWKNRTSLESLPVLEVEFVGWRTFFRVWNNQEKRLHCRRLWRKERR